MTPGTDQEQTNTERNPETHKQTTKTYIPPGRGPTRWESGAARRKKKMHVDKAAAARYDRAAAAELETPQPLVKVKRGTVQSEISVGSLAPVAVLWGPITPPPLGEFVVKVVGFGPLWGFYPRHAFSPHDPPLVAPRRSRSPPTNGKCGSPGLGGARVAAANS